MTRIARATGPSVTRALDPRVYDTPLVRVEFCSQPLVNPFPPRESRRPLRVLRPRRLQDAGDARHMLPRLKALGEDIRELIRSQDTNQSEVAILNSFMREVFPNVDVLGTFTAPNDVVAPIDARIIVLIDRSESRPEESHVLEERTEVDNFHRCRRRCIIFRLSRR